ncbi:type II toxin-antitoxin system VapC family toxin [Aquirufa sp. ROCK2-A2]
MEYLLDTNIIIHLLDASLSKHGMKQMKEIVNQEIMLSVITKMETLGYNFDSEEEQILFETFISQSSILTLNNDIVEETIWIRKIKKIKLPDAIIAATAKIHDLILISENTSDFNNIPGLKIINPNVL